MDQSQVELLVRLTARVSAAFFAAALILFASGQSHRHRHVRYGIRLFVAFMLAHTIHFGAVVSLAALTGSENIRTRGGWALAMIVAALFYHAAFRVLRAWRHLGSGQVLARTDRLAARLGVAFIALVFLNSYLGRVGSMPVYWVPAIGMLAIVAAYFVRLRVAARPVRSAAGAEFR